MHNVRVVHYNLNKRQYAVTIIYRTFLYEKYKYEFIVTNCLIDSRNHSANINPL